MPLLETVLEDIFPPRKRGKEAVNEILSENGLSLEESIVEIKSIIDNTTDQHLKAKLLDIVLSMHGVKSEKNTAIAVPNITFIFPSSEPSFLTSSERIIDISPEKEK